MNRTAKIILTVSLLLNVMLAGLAIGYGYKAWRWRMPQDAVQMSAEVRAQMEEKFSSMRGGMKETFVEMRAARKEITDVMAAEPFDAAAYDAAWAKLAALQAKMSAARAEAVRELAQTMGPADRQALSRYVASHRHRGGRCGPGKSGAPDAGAAPVPQGSYQAPSP